MGGVADDGGDGMLGCEEAGEAEGDLGVGMSKVLRAEEYLGKTNIPVPADDDDLLGHGA